MDRMDRVQVYIDTYNLNIIESSVAVAPTTLVFPPV